MILLIDNYDSFVHNLARYFERLGQVTHVVRNDAIDVDTIAALRPAAIVLSPGPCTPRQAGASLGVVQRLHATIPMLGVCLGHQVIAEAFGGWVVQAHRPVHGQASAIEHSGTGLFDGLPLPLTVGRYHSLVVEPEMIPFELRPTAWTRDGVLMALEHKRWPVFGVQFHPESILTEAGYELLGNFLRLAGIAADRETTGLAAGERPHNNLSPPALPAGPITF